MLGQFLKCNITVLSHQNIAIDDIIERGPLNAIYFQIGELVFFFATEVLHVCMLRCCMHAYIMAINL